MFSTFADMQHRVRLATLPPRRPAGHKVVLAGGRLLTALAVFVVGAGLLSGTAKAGDILDVINQDPSYSKFSTLLRSTGMEAELKAGGAYTIFVPSNAAFDELQPEVRHRLFSSDSAAAREAVSNLVVEKRYMPKDIAHNRVLLTAIGGQAVMVDGTEGRLTADGTEILSVDTSPSNGVIYTIDGVGLNQKVFDRDMD
jgi:uncharacterized surface protein with fasciclin (FAS1) repeats